MNEHQNDLFNDRRFVFMLMLEIFEVSDILTGELDNTKMNVIKGKQVVFSQ